MSCNCKETANKSKNHKCKCCNCGCSSSQGSKSNVVTKESSKKDSNKILIEG